MQEYESNTDELNKKNEAFIYHCRLYDSNQKKSEIQTSLIEELIKVIFLFDLLVTANRSRISKLRNSNLITRKFILQF